MFSWASITSDSHHYHQKCFWTSYRCSLEGLMLKLKPQYFGHLMWRVDSLEKTLMLGGIEGDNRGWDGLMASPTQWTCVWVNSRSWWWTGRPGMLWFMGSQRVGHDWVTELNWTDRCTISSPGCYNLCFDYKQGWTFSKYFCNNNLKISISSP